LSEPKRRKGGDETEGMRLMEVIGEKMDSKVKDEQNWRGFCKYLPLWRHVVCHVGFGCSRGAFGTSHGTLNTV